MMDYERTKAMTKQNMIGNARERYYRSIGSKVSILFGVTMAVYCLMIIHQRIRSQYFDTTFFMTFIALALAIMILLDKNRNILTSMGLYSLGMALTRLPLSLRFIFFPDPQYIIVVGIIFLVIAINMFYSAWQYLHGVCRGYITTTVEIFFLWIFYAGLLVATLAGIMPSVEGTSFERILDWEILASNVLLFSAYLIVLGTDEIHDGCEMEMANSHLKSFRSVLDAGYDSSVSRKVAGKLMAGPVTWKAVDAGPVETELRFIVSYTDYALFATAQKWKGDDRIFFTLSENPWEKTMVEATRFTADEITCDGDGVDNCTHLLFRNRNGDCYSIEVLDDNVRVIT